MAALTAAYDARRKDGGLVSYPMGAVKINKGALVSVTASTGYVAASADTASTSFVGVAYETVDNTGGAAGGKTIRVQKTGVYRYNSSGAAQTDIGKAANIVDDNTAKTAATTNSIVCGVVAGFVDSTHIDIRIDGKVN